VSTARDEILARIRAALRDVPGGERAEDVPVPRAYRRHGDATDPVERFAERVRDYHAEVVAVDADSIGAAISKTVTDLGLRRLVVPSGLPADWRPGGVEVVEDHGLTAQELDAIDGALTGCAAAIAETGTLVLEGQRLITLVPDHHICVVRAEQVVGSVPEAIAAVRPPAPVTLISGPSASSDIELERVEGVHGPRNLVVLLAGRPATE
jgi:L-lactate dehydrogenase complex protein LldG